MLLVAFGGNILSKLFNPVLGAFDMILLRA